MHNSPFKVHTIECRGECSAGPVSGNLIMNGRECRGSVLYSTILYSTIHYVQYSKVSKVQYRSEQGMQGQGGLYPYYVMTWDIW